MPNTFWQPHVCTQVLPDRLLHHPHHHIVGVTRVGLGGRLCASVSVPCACPQGPALPSSSPRPTCPQPSEGRLGGEAWTRLLWGEGPGLPLWLSPLPWEVRASEQRPPGPSWGVRPSWASRETAQFREGFPEAGSSGPVVPGSSGQGQEHRHLRCHQSPGAQATPPRRPRPLRPQRGGSWEARGHSRRLPVMQGACAVSLLGPRPRPEACGRLRNAALGLLGGLWAGGTAEPTSGARLPPASALAEHCRRHANQLCPATRSGLQEPLPQTA